MCLRGYNLCTVLFVVVMCVQQAWVNAASAADSEATASHLSGKFIMALGTNTSSPLLRMLGLTFMNYEGNVKNVEDRLTETLCQFHPCTEWESWTPCPVTLKGQFGTMTRSRRCKRNDSMCASKERNDLLTEESKLCEGSSPETFTYTNGFCIRYISVPKIQHEAHAACEIDGGHLVNIDTKAKYDAIDALLKQHGHTSAIWINGNRTQAGGAWHYTYGPTPDFEIWNVNEPSNASTELCKVQENVPRKWSDRGCTPLYTYVCEVV